MAGKASQTGETGFGEQSKRKHQRSQNVPLNNSKSYAKGPPPLCAIYWLIVPPKNKIRTTVVAIQKGPYRSGLPSRTSRKLSRGHKAAQQRASTELVSTSKNCA